jgi:hypothetical protein
MHTPTLATASRFVCALAAGAALSGCATYGPAYPAYPAYAAAPVAAYPAAPYYAYGDPYYDYYGPGYYGSGLALDFRFHDRGYRGYRGPGYYHGYGNRGHAWTGPRAGGHWGGAPRLGGGGHWGGAPRGGGARGGFGGGGHGHR